MGNIISFDGTVSVGDDSLSMSNGLTPVEIVGCEVCEAGNPLALDNG